MNRKQKQIAHGSTIPWVKKNSKYQSVFILRVFVALFVLCSICKAANDSPIISAVQIKGISTNDDFIEIYNPSCVDKDISNWKLRKRISTGTESSIKVLSDNTVLHAKGYFLWSNSGFADAIKADQSTSATLSENYSIALVNGDETVDSMTWGTNPFSFSKNNSYPNNPTALQVLKKDVSGNFTIESNYHPKNSTFINNDELDSCPKKDPQPEPAPKIYANGIFINELFPAPDGADENGEFIELYNSGDEDADLIDWKLQDYKKVSGVKDINLAVEHTFLLDAQYCAQRESKDNCQLKSKKYFVVVGKDYYKKGLTLNNANGDVIGLLDPSGKLVMQVDYPTAKENLSYSFNGTDWHWTQFLSPGEENKFENVPDGTLEMDKDVFVNVYASFSVAGLSKSAKITWDFGDGHKSYLQKTRHKYVKLGTYAANVKFSQGSEDVVKNFTVQVKKIPHPDVDIVSIVANPKGSDVLGEKITLKNKSKKRIDLKGWSIATASKKNMVNHPINLKFVLKKKQTKTLTKEYSKFTLNNKKGKIELRYPDGKAAYKLKYDNGGQSIADDEAYQKVIGGWKWVGGAARKTAQSALSVQDTITNPPAGGQNTINEIPNNTVVEIPTEEIITQHKIGIKNILEEKNNLVKIELLNNIPHVLGAAIVRQENGAYYFTPQTQQEQHYAVVFLKDIFSSLNFSVNSLLNKILYK